MILGIDPGRDKCGLAIMTDNKEVIEQDVVGTETIVEVVAGLLDEYQVEIIVIGDGTLSQKLKTRLKTDCSKTLKIQTVDETNSTLEARERYWRANPPQGWRKFIPTSFQTPSRPVDDYVALILIERFLENLPG